MKKFPDVKRDKESGLPKKYVAGLSTSTAKARAAHWKKTSKMSDSDPRAYEPAPGDATAKTKLSKYTKKYHQMFGEQIGIVIEGAPEKIEGTNCANCIHWVKESEKPVDKSELNEYGGLKAPNEAYIEMSKHADLVTLPGKAVVKIKAYCNHEDIHDFVTERMCCAYWDGEGVKREYKGISPKMDESVELDETIVKVDGKYRLVSKKTGRNLGTYDTKAGAMKRERQVQYFKHMGEEKMTDYKPKVGDRISTIKGGQNTGKVEKVEGGHVYFRSDYKRNTLGRGDDYYPIFKTHVSNVRLHEEVEQIDELDQKTLKSYIKKNVDSKAYEKNPNRDAGLERATTKVARSQATSTLKNKVSKLRYTPMNKHKNPYEYQNSRDELVNRKVSEEVEQVDEGKLAKALAVGAMSLASMGAKAHTDTTKSVAQLAKERPTLAQRLQDIGATGQVPASDKRAAELQRKQDQEMPASERRAKELKKEEVEQVDEAFDKSSPSHAKAKELVSNYGNRSAMRAVYHGDGTATIHTTGDKKVSSATRVDHIHDQAGLGYNRSAEAYENSSKSKGGLKFKTKETEGKSIYGSHEIHISHKGMKEEVEQVDEAVLAPFPGEKWKDHAVMVKDKQRIVIHRKNIKNYPEHEGWKEVAPGMKQKNEEVDQINEIGNTEKGVKRLRDYVASDRSKVKIKDVLDAKRSADPDKAIEKLAKRQGYKSKALKKIRAFDAAKNPKPPEKEVPMGLKVYPPDMKYHGDSYEPTGNVIKEGFLSFLRKKKPALKKPPVSHKHMRAVFSNIERQTRVAKPQQTGPVIHRHTIAAYESVEQIDERNKANAEAKKRVLRTAGVNAAISGKVPFTGSALQMGRKAAKKLPSKGLAKAYRELPRVAEEEVKEGKADTSLAAKARKSGISLGTLRKVYNRGVAAWNSGHRPGTTPQQWGHARVNSYITKGKTYHTADKDLRRESVDVNEAFEREFGDK